MKKTNIKRRNSLAKEVRTSKYHMRIVESKKRYSRKEKTNDRNSGFRF